MRRPVAAGVLGLVVAVGVEAQPLASPGALATGRELMAQGDLLGAADAFHGALHGGPAGRYTVRVGVFCDVANLERQVRASANAPELFVLRRSVGGRPCLALLWGLFPSRAAARAAVATIPVPLRAPGQSPVLVSAILPPGAPPAAAVAAAPPPAPPAERPALVAPVAPEPAPQPEVVEPQAPAVAEPVPAAVSPVTPEESPAAIPSAEPARVPALEITAAYSGLWDDAFSEDGGDGFLETGWVLSLCGNVTRSLGVVGEVSGHYGSDEILDTLGAPLAIDRDILGVHAGLRYTHRSEGFAAPYAQALAGWTRTGVEFTGQRVVEDAFSIQPGVGLNFRLSRSVGLGLGADYRLVFGEDESRNELRFHAGLVLGIGGR
jgi:hypothetical protein